MDKIVNDAHTSKLQTLQNYYAAEDVLVFDIETTGFTAEHTALYLIGCAYYEDHRWKICQWFNQDGLSEEKILREFLLFCKDFKYFVTYNGDGFDIPYLTKKTIMYGMENPFSKKESIDIYKQIRFLKEHLHLENMKQKSVERFLGIHRLDKYSGGDLIKVYQDYVKLPVKTNKQLLLQHNYEDIEGLLDCASMLAYCQDEGWMSAGAPHVGASEPAAVFSGTGISASEASDNRPGRYHYNRIPERGNDQCTDLYRGIKILF